MEREGTIIPQVTVFVRNEDIEKWRAIDKKSLWIHQGLNPSDSPHQVESIPQPILKPPNGESEEPVDKAIPLGQPCCNNRSPCRHWQYNDLDATWKNSLTGEGREVV